MNDIPSRLQDALEGRYRIERELGAGGMATVYLARDLKHSRPVALSIPTSSHSSTPARPTAFSST
jgi:serine/threonine-protein kinase